MAAWSPPSMASARPTASMSAASRPICSISRRPITARATPPSRACRRPCGRNTPWTLRPPWKRPLAKLEKVQVVKIEIQANGATQRATVHVALEDATGDLAILEYLDGKLVVHHGRQYRVMTNAPDYDQQLKLLSELDYANPTMETVVPGNVNPRARFQRATYYLAVLSPPKTQREGVAGMFSLIRNVSIPFGAPVNGSTFDTEYRTVSDLTQKNAIISS